MQIQFYKKDNYYLFNKGDPLGLPLLINNIISKTIDTIEVVTFLTENLEKELLLLQLQFKIDKFKKELYDIIEYEYKGEHKYIIKGKLNIVNYLINNYNVNGIFTKYPYDLNQVQDDKKYIKYTELETQKTDVTLKYYNLNNPFRYNGNKPVLPEILAFHIDRNNPQKIRIEKTNTLTSSWLDEQYGAQSFITFSYNPLGVDENYNITTKYKIVCNLNDLYNQDQNYKYQYLNTNIFKIYLHVSNNKIDITQIKDMYIIIDFLPKLEIIDINGDSQIFTIGQQLFYNISKESEILKNNPLFFQQQQINKQIEYNNYKIGQINSYVNLVSNLTNITNNPLNVITNTTTNLLNNVNNSINYNMLRELKDKQIEQLSALYTNISTGGIIDFKIDNNNILFSVEKKTPILERNKYILNCFKQKNNMTIDDFTKMYYYGGYLLNNTNVPKYLINQANYLLRG